MARVFISYVEEDEGVAKRIAEGLERFGHAAWFYGRNAVPGVSYLEQTRLATDSSDSVVLVISEKSVGSRQVDIEVVYAFEKGRPFVPLLVEMDHPRFQVLAPSWRQMCGDATSIRVERPPTDGEIERIAAGLRSVASPRIGAGPAEGEAASPGARSIGRQADPTIPPWRRRWFRAVSWGGAVVALGVLAVVLWGGRSPGGKRPGWLGESAWLACADEIDASPPERGGAASTGSGACERLLTSVLAEPADPDRVGNARFRAEYRRWLVDEIRDEADILRVASTVGLFANSLDVDVVEDRTLRERVSGAFQDCRRDSLCDRASVFGAFDRDRPGENGLRVAVPAELVGSSGQALSAEALRQALANELRLSQVDVRRLEVFRVERPAAWSGTDVEVHRRVLAFASASRLDAVAWRAAGLQPARPGVNVSLSDGYLDLYAGREGVLLADDEPAASRPGAAVPGLHAGWVASMVDALQARRIVEDFLADRLGRGRPLMDEFRTRAGREAPCSLRWALDLADRSEEQEVLDARERLRSCLAPAPVTVMGFSKRFLDVKRALEEHAAGDWDAELRQLGEEARQALIGDSARRFEARIRTAMAPRSLALGDVDESLRDANELLRLARVENLPFFERAALYHLLRLAYHHGDMEAVHDGETRLLVWAERQENPAAMLRVVGMIAGQRRDALHQEILPGTWRVDLCKKLVEAFSQPHPGMLPDVGTTCQVLTNLVLARSCQGEEVASLADRVLRLSAARVPPHKVGMDLLFLVFSQVLSGSAASPQWLDQVTQWARSLDALDDPADDRVKDRLYRALELVGFSAYLAFNGRLEAAREIVVGTLSRLKALDSQVGVAGTPEEYRFVLPAVRVLLRDILGTYHRFLPGNQTSLAVMKQFLNPDAAFAGGETDLQRLHADVGGAVTWGSEFGRLALATHWALAGWLELSPDPVNARTHYRKAADGLSSLSMERWDPKTVRETPVLALLDLWQVGVASGIGALAMTSGDAVFGRSVAKEALRRHDAFTSDVLSPAIPAESLVRVAVTLATPLVALGLERLAEWDRVTDEVAWWSRPARLPRVQTVLEGLHLPPVERSAAAYAESRGTSPVLWLLLRAIQDSRILDDVTRWEEAVATLGTVLSPALDAARAGGAYDLASLLGLLRAGAAAAASIDDALPLFEAAATDAERLGLANAILYRMLGRILWGILRPDDAPPAADFRDRILEDRARLAPNSPAWDVLTAELVETDLEAGQNLAEALEGLERLRVVDSTAGGRAFCAAFTFGKLIFGPNVSASRNVGKSTWFDPCHFSVALGASSSGKMDCQVSRCDGARGDDDDVVTLEPVLHPLLLSFLVGDEIRFQKASEEIPSALKDLIEALRAPPPEAFAQKHFAALRLKSALGDRLRLLVQISWAVLVANKGNPRSIGALQEFLDLTRPSGAEEADPAIAYLADARRLLEGGADVPRWAETLLALSKTEVAMESGSRAELPALIDALAQRSEGSSSLSGSLVPCYVESRQALFVTGDTARLESCVRDHADDGLSSFALAVLRANSALESEQPIEGTAFLLEGLERLFESRSAYWAVYHAARFSGQLATLGESAGAMELARWMGLRSLALDPDELGLVMEAFQSAWTRSGDRNQEASGV